MRIISSLLLLGAFGADAALRGKTEETVPQQLNLKEAREHFDNHSRKLLGVDQPKRKLQFGFGGFGGGSNSATNIGPNAVDDIAHTEVDTPVFIWALLNDDDADGFFLRVDSFTQPANGAVSSIWGKFEYVPNDGFEGTDSFTYTISDTSGATDTATVTITVGSAAAVASGNVSGADTPVDPVSGNAGPVAVNDVAETSVNTNVKVFVMSNDYDPDGFIMTLENFSQPANGHVGYPIFGSVIYEPNEDFVGTDSFTYTISDTSGATATGTVTVTVNP